MAYAVQIVFPQANHIGCSAKRYASSETNPTDGGMPYFGTHADKYKAIRFDSRSAAEAFISKYQKIGFIDPKYDWRKDSKKVIDIVQI